jgi:hypothetical protein
VRNNVVRDLAAVTAADDWSAARRLYAEDDRLRVSETLG